MLQKLNTTTQNCAIRQKLWKRKVITFSYVFVFIFGSVLQLGKSKFNFQIVQLGKLGLIFLSHDLDQIFLSRTWKWTYSNEIKTDKLIGFFLSPMRSRSNKQYLMMKRWEKYQYKEWFSQFAFEWKWFILQ